MGLGNSSNSEFSTVRVDAADQCWLFFARALESEIGEQFNIPCCDVRKCLCGSACICRGHVCHAIMSYILFDINGIEVGCRA